MLMTPTMARLPSGSARWEGRGAIWTMNGEARYIPFTTPWNVTGQPAAAVPAGFSPDGLPLSVQLIGRPTPRRRCSASPASSRPSGPGQTANRRFPKPH